MVIWLEDLGKFGSKECSPVHILADMESGPEVQRSIPR